MIRTNLFRATDSHKIVAKQGNFEVLEYLKDISVKPEYAYKAFFEAKMNVRRRQVICHLNGDNGIITQAGAMQLMMGDINVSTNVGGAWDFVKNTISSTVTKESLIKPLYTGEGILLLEPTYKYVLLEDLADWRGSLVIENGMFLTCDDTVKMRVTSRQNVSSTVLGNEGFFNLELYGHGIAVLESPVPAAELILIDMEDDVIKIDGSMAIAWSNTLKFSVKKSTDTLIGSAMSKEGFLNVYEGTGRLLIAPVMRDGKVDVEKN